MINGCVRSQQWMWHSSGSSFYHRIIKQILLEVISNVIHHKAVWSESNEHSSYKWCRRTSGLVAKICFIYEPVLILHPGNEYLRISTYNIGNEIMTCSPLPSSNSANTTLFSQGLEIIHGDDSDGQQNAVWNVWPTITKEKFKGLAYIFEYAIQYGFLGDSSDTEMWHW